MRIADGTIRLDGHLTEEVWDSALPLTDFVQTEPNEGAPPFDSTEVRFLYDATALYVGARMSSSRSGIQAPLGRRDVADQAESLTVMFDTYLDRRTAYSFGVTASGVRLDSLYPRDERESADPSFDPIWEARTSIHGDGWTAELWIPFSQLRFNDAPDQVWGLNLRRFIPTSNEEDFWVLIPRTVAAWASRFGELYGLTGIRPTRRLELLPYVAGSSAINRSVDPDNPFNDGSVFGNRFGLDVKFGLGPSLTLDVTLNPDFGQVEADPAEVNLTAFETIFPEKRPFFTEGSRLLSLQLGGPMFNSRRIGLRPSRSVSGDFVDYPQASTILGAAKITGRTSPNTSLGILAAVTDDESARVFNLDTPGIAKTPVAPRTAYALGRIGRQFGESGSTINLLIGHVHRNLQTGDELSSLMPRNAFSMGSDAILRFKDGEYETSFLAALSHVTGDAPAIERIQRSSVHYYQRPDRNYSTLDPTATSIHGYRTQAGIARRNGRHWLWDLTLLAQSPGMDFNDLGRTIAGDSLSYNANVRYRETQPGSVFRTYSLVINSRAEWDYGGDINAHTLRPSLTATFPNFWTLTTGVTRTFRVLDFGLTRGGPLMGRPAGWTMTGTVGNATTSQTRWSGGLTWMTNEDGGLTRRVTTSLGFRPGPRWQVSIDPEYDRTVDAQQYVTTLKGGGPATYGGRYVFAYVERRTISSQVRMGFTLKPDLNLDVYAEPFAASGRYHDFGELLKAGGRERLTYGSPAAPVTVEPDGDRVVSISDLRFTLENSDFHVRSFRSNVVLRWEWRPGSTVYVVWQQDREFREPVGRAAGISDVMRSLGAPGANVFALKTSFWLPVK
jgi:hypothetical protein